VQAQVEVLNGMGALPAGVEVVVAPSALHAESTLASLRKEVAVALQDVHSKAALGAYTGSHAIEQVKELGIPWVLAGHSERRTIWKETDADTAAKTRAALDAGLKVAVCIGETLAEREAGQTQAVCERQLAAVADALAGEGAEARWAAVVVAYEPVWAIGTGKVATKEQAQEVHAALRAWVAGKAGAEVAAALRIVYGGSVTAASAPSLIAEADIDGFLVGGASLKPEFVDIIKAAGAK
jgi:triosephosphate isomerase